MEDVSTHTLALRLFSAKFKKNQNDIRGAVPHDSLTSTNRLRSVVGLLAPASRRYDAFPVLVFQGFNTPYENLWRALRPLDNTFAPLRLWISHSQANPFHSSFNVHIFFTCIVARSTLDRPLRRTRIRFLSSSLLFSRFQVPTDRSYLFPVTRTIPNISPTRAPTGDSIFLSGTYRYRFGGDSPLTLNILSAALGDAALQPLMQARTFRFQYFIHLRRQFNRTVKARKIVSA
ncbi:hypothetical protein B0H10DRAFT_81137 [Mycena sp. CBHHK59/15]|nr:hypothetical protein B0H10DRAFT_81137 [Mycena sp. CBHHK59/15]